MIYYTNGRWGISALFQLDGSVFPKAATVSLPCAIIAFFLIYFRDKDGDDEQQLAGAGVIWAGYNMLVGFLIVFRTNQAYSRFWEGTTLLHQVRGEWFNATSSVFAFCSNKPEKSEQVNEFQQIMVRLVSLLFCSAAHQVSSFEKHDDFEVLDIYGIDPTSLKHLRASPDRCETVLQWIQRLIIEGSQDGSLDVPPPILSRVFQELSRGIVNLNNVRKIKEVPFPFPYAQMLAAMMVLHSASTPWMASQTIASPIVGGVLSFCVTCGFWSLHYIAQEIDQPFGEDLNDINIRGMLADFNESLLFLTEPETRAVPRFNLNGMASKPSKRHFQSVSCAVLDDPTLLRVGSIEDVKPMLACVITAVTNASLKSRKRKSWCGAQCQSSGDGRATCCKWPTWRRSQEKSGGPPVGVACAEVGTLSANSDDANSGVFPDFSEDGDSTKEDPPDQRDRREGTSAQQGDHTVQQSWCSRNHNADPLPDDLATKHQEEREVGVRFAI